MFWLGLKRLTFLSVSLLFLMPAASVSHAYAAGIRITGISPSVAYAGDIVHVYGEGATPGAAGAAVAAMLSGPEIVLYNQSGIVLPSNGSAICSSYDGYGTYTVYPYTVYIMNGSIYVVLADPSQDNVTLGWAYATASGTWDISFIAPNVIPRIYDVFVFDNGTLTSDVVRFQVSVQVILPSPFSIDYVSPSSGSAGTTVRLGGSGASGGEIRIFFDAMMVASINGYNVSSWSTTFQVPSTNAGTHTIKAVDVVSGAMAAAQFAVIETAPLVIMSYQRQSCLFS